MLVDKEEHMSDKDVVQESLTQTSQDSQQEGQSRLLTITHYYVLLTIRTVKHRKISCSHTTKVP